MSWLETTQQGIQKLFREGYFDNWEKIEKDKIIFYLHPETKISDDWMDARTSIYLTNADKLKVMARAVDFYVYPSLEFGKTLGIVPATSFISSQQIHGHPDQSPGHELTHILLGEVNTSENLSPNGLWAEGICVYLDGTNTDRKKHANSKNYANEITETPWQNWGQNVTGTFYPLVGSIIQYLDESFGWEKVLMFLKELKNSGNNAAGLSELIFNKKYSQLQEGWRRSDNTRPGRNCIRRQDRAKRCFSGVENEFCGQNRLRNQKPRSVF